MKKTITRLIMLILAVALLCTVAFAAEVGEQGVEQLQWKIGYSGKMLDADGKEVTATDGVYKDVAKIELTIDKTIAGSYELIYMVQGSEVTAPKEENLKFIDQTTGTGDSIQVLVFPSDLTEGTYTIVRSNDQGVTGEIVATFNYGTTEQTPSYKLGDVNEDGRITATDALWVLQYTAGNRQLTDSQKLAADVNKDGRQTATDALWILQSTAGNRTF